jgi:SAM-dependent methyltransferase
MARYASGDTPWDSGVTPPEVVQLIESGITGRGWALDVGCGTGATALYLANAGFRVLGIDLVADAVRRARARVAGASFVIGDVTHLDMWHVMLALAIDVGCLHGLTPAQQAQYRMALARRMLPGAPFLLYALLREEGVAEHGLRETDIAAFSVDFDLETVSHGLDRGRSSAWYLFRRKRG